MMDLEARIAACIRAFTHYNRYKKRLMGMNDPLGSRVILELFPLCIHINHPALPGYTGSDDCPCGIKCMDWPLGTIQSLSAFSPIRLKPGEFRNLVPRNREIEGLFTIGSVGPFQDNNPTAGNGFIALAAVIMGRWNPILAACMALFFGFGLLVVALHGVGAWRLLAALVVGGLAWGLLAPWLGSIGLPVPGWIAVIVAVGLVLVGRGFRGRGTR